MQQNLQEQQEDEYPEQSRYLPFSVTNIWRRVDPPITLRGKEVARYKSVVISEYVDKRTGEILPAGKLRDDTDLWPTVYASERCMQRESCLKSLRKEVQEFAYFVLTFRNQRRGVTPGFQELVKWYAHLSGKQTCHVRRYVKALEAGNIVAGSSVLAPLFMIAGKSVAAREHLSEDSNASSKFAVLLLKRRASIGLDYQPTWEPQCKENPLASDEGMLGKIGLKLGEYIEFIQRLIHEGKLEPQFP